MVVIAYDWVKGEFTYGPFISRHLAGQYNSRSFWLVLLSDLVADSNTVKAMQRLVHELANDRNRYEGSMKASLKTPSGAKHNFNVNVYKKANGFGLTDRLIITLNDESDNQTPPGES